MTDRGLWPEGLLQWAGRASLFNPLQSLGKMRVLRGLQFFSVFCRRCQLSVLVTALWLSPTPSIPGGSVDERGCPVPAPSQAQLPPLGRQAPGALQGLALRPPPLLGLADAAASLSSVSLCPEPPSLRSRWARPPACPSGAWTPGRACNPRPSRGPSRAHPRPLEGAPPRPAPRCLPGLACTFSLQRMSPARPVPRPCSGPARDSCGKTQRLQAPVSLRTRHTPPRVLPPFCPSAK